MGIATIFAAGFTLNFETRSSVLEIVGLLNQFGGQ